MILIGQTIMSPNGDRNFMLTQCEFSVDFSFLRSLRASQLDAIYYIFIIHKLENFVDPFTLYLDIENTPNQARIHFEKTNRKFDKCPA